MPYATRKTIIEANQQNGDKPNQEMVGDINKLQNE